MCGRPSGAAAAGSKPSGGVSLPGFPAGHCAFIVGPSGSGKSTLLYLLGCAGTGPDSGLIRIDGRDLTTMSEAGRDAYRRDKVGFIFQSFNLIGKPDGDRERPDPLLPPAA